MQAQCLPYVKKIENLVPTLIKMRSAIFCQHQGHIQTGNCSIQMLWHKKKNTQKTFQKNKDKKMIYVVS